MSTIERLLEHLADIGYDEPDLLEVLGDFLKDRADADGDSEGFYPNREMQILNYLENIRG